MNIIPLFVAIPLMGAFITPIIGRLIRRSEDVIGNLATFYLVITSFWMLKVIREKGVATFYMGGWIPPIGITLVVDALTVFMLITVNLVSLMVTLFSVEYMKKFTSKPRFYTLLLLMMAGMNGVMVTGDLFNLFVFFEIAAIASYALVAFGIEHEELEASFKYQVLSGVGTLLILLGIALMYALTGTLNMADISRSIPRAEARGLILLISTMFLMGFGLKTALVPFHAWLPDAHPSAPAPISAMLSGVFIKVLGVYAMVRVFFNIIGMSALLSQILMALGIVSMVVGALLALGQTDIKRMLAYSSISQVGYIMLGIGLATPLGLWGGLFHLFNHALFKSLLFLNSGALEYMTGTRELKRYGGLAEKMPVTGATSLIASLSISGIPPLNGFWSKLFIIVAAVKAGYTLYAGVAIAIGVVTLAYFLKLQRLTFFGKTNPALQRMKEVPLFMCLPMIILALLCIGVGIAFPLVAERLVEPASKVLTQGLEYARFILGSQ